MSSEGLSRSKRDKCLEIIHFLKQFKVSQLFLYPVDPIRDGIPNYFEVIRKPMDIETVYKKINTNVYKSVDQWKDDVRTIWKNAKKFNQPGDFAYIEADFLSTVFEEKVKFFSDDRVDDWIREYEAISDELSKVMSGFSFQRPSKSSIDHSGKKHHSHESISKIEDDKAFDLKAKGGKGYTKDATEIAPKKIAASIVESQPTISLAATKKPEPVVTSHHEYIHEVPKASTIPHQPSEPITNNNNSRPISNSELIMIANIVNDLDHNRMERVSNIIQENEYYDTIQGTVELDIEKLSKTTIDMIVRYLKSENLYDKT